MKMQFLFLIIFVIKVDLLFADNYGNGQSCNNIADQNPTRPCPSNDVPCIRNYFQGYYVTENTPFCACGANEVIIDNDVQIDLPYLNITSFFYDIYVTGLSTGYVTDFVVDYDTDLAVLTTVFADIQMNSSAHYYYLRPNDETIQLDTQVYEHFPGLTLVTMFKSAQYPSLTYSFSIASGGLNPYVDIGSCFTESPEIENLRKQIAASFQITIREALLPRAKYLAQAFIGANLLC